MRWQSTRGFSVLELMLVVSIIGIVSAISVIQIGNALPGMKSDGAMRVVMAQLNTARNLAVAQRRYMRVNFLLPSKIQIVRVEVNSGGTVTGTTTLSTVDFEGGVTYNKISGLIDTPDALGMASAVDFGSATTIQFATDGSLVDQAGSPLNGTIVLANANTKTSSRAITVLGSTGHVRAYKWNGAAWTLV